MPIDTKENQLYIQYGMDLVPIDSIKELPKEITTFSDEFISFPEEDFTFDFEISKKSIYKLKKYSQKV